MQCSLEQIEEKRKLAKQKLARKYSTKQINRNENKIENAFVQLGPNKSDIVRPNLMETKMLFSRNESPSKYISPVKERPKPYEKPVINFYGKSTITGTCSLISQDRFAVELSGFNTNAIELFKSIPTRSYDPKTKLWDFHIKDYDMLMQKLIFLKPEVVVAKLPSFVINCCKLPFPDYSLIDLSKIDSELLSTLMPFQVDGVCFGIDKDGRCLIADEMGLGKTFQALAIASYFRENWPLLVITTSSMKNVWEETTHKYLPSVSLLHTQYMISAKDYIGDAKVLIISHDLLPRCVEKLMNRQFGVIIIDESHTLKNFKAKCTKAATDLCKIAKRVVLLSGTPALSRPSELYTQLALIDEKFFGTFLDYSKRYCDGKKSNFGWDSTGKSNLKELEIILAKKFMIRRTKEDVLKMLPNKVQEAITLDVKLNHFSEVDKRNLNALAQKYYRGKKGVDKHTALLTFFAETAKIKIPSVCSYILQTLEESNKIIIFAHHLIMLNAIQQILLKSKKEHIRIDGSTPSSQRKYLVDKFQLDDNCNCAVLSITAANAGITLTAAKLVLFAELHWNPSILNQAESRAHRIGQEGQVLVRYLLAPGTADDSIWPLLQSKQKILSQIGLCKDSLEEIKVIKQNSSKEKSIAECLNSSITAASTLDISTYFSSPKKFSENDAGDAVNIKEKPKLFDDDFDEALGQFEIDI